MKKIIGFVLTVSLMVFIMASAGFAGPSVAIVKHDDHKLVGESFKYEITRTPKGEVPDKFWHPEWSKESEQAIEQMVRDAVRLAGGWPVKNGDVVAIVPNLVIDPFGLTLQGKGNPTFMQCSVTDPRVARAVALLAKESGAKKIYFATQPMSASGYTSLKVWGYEPVAKEAGGEMVGLDASAWKYFKAPHGLALKEYALPTFMVEEVTKLISVPVMKNHCLAGYTGALKNIGIGLPTGRVYGALRYGLPHDKLAKVIIDVCSIKKIDYSVVAAIWGMEGNGPLAGEPVPMDMVIAGADPVAVDAIMLETMGMKPINYGTIRLGEEFGLGTYKGITVAGRQVAEVEKQFAPVPADKRAAGTWGEIIGWAKVATPTYYDKK
jgi:uncharacterized protein (DUF362 family)